ncbi:MAG TPA: class I SAM-dependent methyltransferase [Ktedonobacteraceae bacterium]|nr:class I SAM-dependent methyltransferase [Ktedonobacteraceae bacterium]
MYPLFLFRRKLRQRPSSLASSWKPSITPSPIYYELDGRKYPVNYPYLLPKDEQETDRLNFQHFFLKAVLGGNYIVPLDRIRVETILDVGCGTGVWCREIAGEFKQVNIIGVDLDPSLSRTIAPPANCQFMQADLLRGLPFVGGTFDFTHMRLLVAAIPTRSWPGAVSELMRVTKPGGWIELVECGFGFKRAGPATMRYVEWWDQVGRLRGIETASVAYLDRWLRDAGAKDVEKRILYVPVGQWGGRLGKMLALNMQNGWRGVRGMLCEQLGITTEQFDEVIYALPQEWEHNRTEYAYYIASGRR